jgi:polar amino acid transport system substrate-binding protein
LLIALVLVLQLVGADLAPTGTLRASFIAGNPVQGRVDPQTGATSGPGPDLARELARRLGVQVIITPLPDAGAVLESVTSGKVDIGFLAVEAARATQVDFSDPYLLMGSAYAVPVGSSIKQSSDVDRAGVTIGAVTGQSQEIWVREHVKSARVSAMPTVPANAELAAMLLDRRIDAFAANRTRMEALVRAFPAIRVLPDNFAVLGQAIAVAKGQRSRLDGVNRLVADVLASGLVKASIERAGLSGVEAATSNSARVR